MPRSLWNGFLGFGLVNIAVALESAEKTHDLHFTLLDSRDKSPVGYLRINKVTGKEVPWDKIVKGYEYEKGEFVIMKKEDFEKANVKAARAIEILCFVDEGVIDPVFFEKPYYIVPQKNSEKTYALLYEGMAESKKVGVAKVVLREKQHLAAIVPRGGGLVMEMLRFCHELKSQKELKLPETKGLNRKEVNAAVQLIKGMSENWEPKQYKDTYYDDLMELIDKKIDAAHSGKEYVAVAKTKPPKRTGRQDIMSLLKKSLEERGHTAPTKKTHSRKRKAA